MRLEAHVQDRSEAVYLMNMILEICQLFANYFANDKNNLWNSATRINHKTLF